MAHRSLLRAQLCSAWSRTIAGPYDSRLVNSERGLQTHFCMALNDEFERGEVRRSLFVEPNVIFGADRRCPDLIVCNTRSVIGVVEFKYVPRARPAFAKDLDTLKRLRNTAGRLTISNERYRGNSMAQSYTMAEDAVLCVAAVYSSRSVLELPSEATRAIGPGFLRLDALTRDNGPAEIVDGRRRWSAGANLTNRCRRTKARQFAFAAKLGR